MTNLKHLLLENYSKYFDDLLSGERSLPFGLLVSWCFLFICRLADFTAKAYDEEFFFPRFRFLLSSDETVSYPNDLLFVERNRCS